MKYFGLTETKLFHFIGYLKTGGGGGGGGGGSRKPLNPFWIHHCDYTVQFNTRFVWSFSRTRFFNFLRLLSIADNLCKQFGPRSGPIEHLSWSESKQFGTGSVPERFFLKRVNFEKKVSRGQIRPDKKQIVFRVIQPYQYLLVKPRIFSGFLEKI